MRKAPKTTKNALKRGMNRLLGVRELENIIPPQKLLRRAEILAGFAAIYIVAPKDQKWPVIFGITTDPASTQYSYQKGWWEEHQLHAVLWTPGRPAAERIKKRMADMMQNQRKFFNPKWYNVRVSEAILVAKKAAIDERVPMFDEVERQRRYHAAAQASIEQNAGVERHFMPQILLNHELDAPQSGTVIKMPVRGQKRP